MSQRVQAVEHLEGFVANGFHVAYEDFVPHIRTVLDALAMAEVHLYARDEDLKQIAKYLGMDADEHIDDIELGDVPPKVYDTLAELRAEIAAIRAESDHETENMAAEQAFTLGLIRDRLTAEEAGYLIEHFQLETFYPELHGKLARIAGVDR